MLRVKRVTESKFIAEGPQILGTTARSLFALPIGDITPGTNPVLPRRDLGKANVSPVHSMKTYKGSRVVSPLAPYFDTGNNRLGGPWSRSEPLDGRTTISVMANV